MLIKVFDIQLGATSDSSTPVKNFEQARYEMHVNPDRIGFLEINPNGLQGYARLHVETRRAVISIEDAERIIALANTPAAQAPAAVSQKTTDAIITGMTRDNTSSQKPMWRCSTGKGFMVNVFKHDDPLKDSFHIFESAGYGPDMLAMNYQDTINWIDHPIKVELIQNGTYWNVAKVYQRPDGAVPDVDIPEPDWGAPNE